MLPGDTIEGRFQLLGPVRGGGISLVFPAIDRRTNQRVAVKIINVGTGGPELMGRIEREIRIHETLTHRNIVRCFGSGILPDQRPYLVLEWLDGEDLSVFRRRASMSLRDVLAVAEQVSHALEAAHGRGIIHRDIKPANIFLVDAQKGARPDCRVIDFGVAKMAEAASVTCAGAILGTPSYMAPEQAGFATDVDARADIFSLGVVLFELLTGRLPWTSPSDLARLARIQTERALEVRSIRPTAPVAFAELIEAMLVLDPDQRIPSAKALIARLESVLQDVDARALDESGHDAFDSGAAARPKSESPSEPTNAVLVGFGPIPKNELVEAATELLPDEELKPRKAVRALPRGRRPARAALEEMIEQETVPVRLPRPDVDPLPTVLDVDERTASLNPLARTSDERERASAHFQEVIRELAEPQSSVLYGRVQELEQLTQLPLRLLDTVSAGFLLVVGPAGIGKTRVCLEVESMLASAPNAPELLVGRGEESLRLSPYGFLRRALLDFAGVRPEDSTEVVQRKLLRLIPSSGRIRELLDGAEPPLPGAHYGESAVAGWFAHAGVGPVEQDTVAEFAMGMSPDDPDCEPLDEERVALAALMASALGIPFPKVRAIEAAARDPRLLGEQIRRALDLILRGIAQMRRLVVVVDDAHFLDHESAVLLAELVRPARANHVALIAFALPRLLDGQDASPSLDGRRARVIDLSPLDARAARELVRGMLEMPIESSTLERLVHRAKGNPLFLQQLVRATQATKALVLAASGELELVAPTRDVAEDEIILPTVSAAVTARLARMDTAAAYVLATAAVVGEVFAVDDVAALARLEPERVVKSLHELLLAGFVRARTTSKVSEEIKLEFTHGVIRSVVLARLNRRLRIKLEVAVADLLELNGESARCDIAPRLVLGGLYERAAREYAAAAETALSSGALVSALALAEEGVLLIDRGATEEATRQRLMLLVDRTALLLREEEVASRALDVLEGMMQGDVARLTLLERRVEHALELRRFSEATKQAQAALELCRRMGADAPEARVLFLLGLAFEGMRQWRPALRTLLSAHQLLSTTRSSPKALARVALGLGRLSLASADYRMAQTRFRESEGHADKARDEDSRFFAAIGLAKVARFAGDGPRALRRLARLGLQADSVQRRLMLELERSSALAENAQVAEAEAVLVRMLSALREHPHLAHERRLAILLLGRIWVYGTPDRLPGAEDRLSEIRGRLETALRESMLGDLTLVPALELVLAALAASTQAYDRAEELVERVYLRFVSEGALPEEEVPRLLFLRAHILEHLGRAEGEVREAWGAAIESIDGVASRLDRKARARYLERDLSRAVLGGAKSAGVDLSRHFKIG